MPRALPAVIAVTLAALLQAGLAPYIAIGGTAPNFLMLVVITVALVTGPYEGALTGFAAGLLYDLLGTVAVGPMALVLTIAGYVAGVLHETIFAEGWLLPLTVLAASVLISEMLYGLVLRLVGFEIGFFEAFGARMLPAAVYNTGLALLVYPWLGRVLARERPLETFRRLA